MSKIKSQFLNGSYFVRVGKDGIGTVNIRYFVNGRYVKRSTGIEVDPKMWDEKCQKIKGSTNARINNVSNDKNLRLIEFKNQIDQQIRDYDGLLTHEVVSQILKGEDDVELDDFWELEDCWLDGNLYENAMLLELEGVYVGQDEWEETKDITKEKGKYIKRTEIFKMDQGLTPPFYVRCINSGTEISNTFCIELEDDEDFDPKQLQLVKSDYEVEFLPYGIVSGYIIYKGDKIYSYNETEYRDKGWNNPFVCEEFYN